VIILFLNTNEVIVGIDHLRANEDSIPEGDGDISLITGTKISDKKRGLDVSVAQNTTGFLEVTTVLESILQQLKRIEAHLAEMSEANFKERDF
jgi:hypothetical protein